MKSYYQLKKKIRDVPKLGQNWAEIFSKLTKIGKKIGIMCILKIKNTQKI